MGTRFEKAPPLDGAGLADAPAIPLKFLTGKASALRVLDYTGTLQRERSNQNRFA